MLSFFAFPLITNPSVMILGVRREEKGGKVHSWGKKLEKQE